MKICWDNLEGFHLTRNGVFVKGHNSYIYKDRCIKCGEPYLTEKSDQSEFCSVSCVHRGKKLSDESKKKISIANTGKVPTFETRKKMSKSGSRRGGVSIVSWEGDVKNQVLTVYRTHKDKLGSYEEIRKQKGTEVLEVRCAYCNQWYAPTYEAVRHRLVAINYLNRGEHRFYCSENCKQACPTYRQVKYPKGHKPYKTNKSIWYTNAELRTWREEVLRRADYKCEYCGRKATIAHHNKPKKLEPFFALDPEYGIACCKKCHYKYGHGDSDCSTGYLAHLDCK